MLFKRQLIFKAFLIFFLSACLMHVKSDGQSVNLSNREYRKVANYIYKGCSALLSRQKEFRKDSQSLIILIKYYINSNGIIDSIIPSDNTDDTLRAYIKSMDMHLVHWNKVLPPSHDERILAIPVFIGPENMHSAIAKFTCMQSSLYLTKLFSFSQDPSHDFRERLYLMDPLLYIYPLVGDPTNIISGK